MVDARQQAKWFAGRIVALKRLATPGQLALVLTLANGEHVSVFKGGPARAEELARQLEGDLAGALEQVLQRLPDGE